MLNILHCILEFFLILREKSDSFSPMSSPFLPERYSGDIFDGVLFGAGGTNTSLFEVHHSLCVQYNLRRLSWAP